MKINNAHTISRHHQACFATLVLLCTSLLLIPTQVFAQSSGLNDGESLTTNPKDRAIGISLTVVNNDPPTVPVLVSPTNGSSVTSARPGFNWEESTDESGMSSYSLFLDGNTLYGSIPLVATDNASYTLTKTGTRYILVPKTDIANGNHTWKIRAVDTSDNTRDSATWSFTLDTQAPTFVITDIEDQEVSISAQDGSTVPDSPVETTINEPLLQGTAENSSTVQLTIRIPNQSNQSYSFSANSSGAWQHRLPILPRDTVIELDFTITDPAGNVSVLNDVPIKILQEYVFPTSTPTSTPSPTPETTPTSTSSATPIPSTTPDTTATPTPTSAGPTIPLIGVTLPEAGAFLPSIPVLYPKELAKKLLDTIIPESFTENVPEIVQQSAETAAPVGAAIVAGVLPITSTALVASQFGSQLSFGIFMRILQAIGIIPTPKAQGMVFDRSTNKGIAFATIYIHPLNSTRPSETIVTDTEGFYGGISLAPGEYEITVTLQDGLFPAVGKKPQYLSFYEFYQGETISIKTQQELSLMIPIDMNPQARGVMSLGKILKLLGLRITKIIPYFTIPLFVTAGVIYLFYPTLINGLVTLTYGVLLVYRAVKVFRIPRISGKIVDETGQPIPDATVKVFNTKSSQLTSLLQTNAKGEFVAHVQPENYYLSIVKPEYVWIENNKPQNYLAADVREKPLYSVSILHHL